MAEFETLIRKIVEDKNKVKRITIPSDMCKFMGLKKGDNVKVMIKKIYPSK